MIRVCVIVCLSLATVVSITCAEEPSASIVVDLSEPGPVFPRTMHGIFFEDINYAADGGLYAELVQNRSFEHRDRLYAWSPFGEGDSVKLAIAEAQPLNAHNEHFLKIEADSPGVGVVNTGFGGIHVTKDAKYLVSLYIRGSGQSGGIVVRLIDKDNQSLGETKLATSGDGWQKAEGTIVATARSSDVRLAVLVSGKGSYDLDMISLFPAETFRGRPNGLRADIAELLAEMKPGFMRFPGGCIVEGRELNNAYRWKDTVGDIAERTQNWNLWANRQSPQYHQTYGLGFFEFFQLCEDIGAEPVPVVNCGMACQARRGRPAPLDELGLWVQDALDLIEFANGPVTSTWGAERAAMGHHEPFNMKYLGIGNEQWSAEYFDRYEVFHKAIRERYPEIKLISSSGPHPAGDLWSYAWDRFHTDTQADLVDEHYYRPPQWFLENAHRYDEYDRSGPKVFAGEFAAHTTGRKNNLEAALAEAAFMTGLWRNADIVDMACYAPLFARTGNVQWAPDLIWFDNARSYGSPSYYVQQMYSRNLPELMARTEVSSPEVRPDPLRGQVGIGTWRTQAEFKDIKVVSNGKTLYEFDPNAGLDDWEEHNGDWQIVDGVIRQTSEAENVRLFTGEPSWQDYAITLRARKLAGAEGFLVSFAVPHPNTPTWWNLGGWNNTRHGLELRGSAGEQIDGKIEINRWYEIRIEVKGPSVFCYLDGKLLQQFTQAPHPALYAASGYNPDTEEAVLAVANPTAQPISTSIETRGRTLASSTAYGEVLANSDPHVENSLDNPRRVTPEQTSATVTGPVWKRRFPPHSFTVLKLKTQE